MSRARVIAGLVLVVLAVSMVSGAPGDKPAKPVDLGSFTREIMQLRIEGDTMDLAMWFPTEFFIHSAMQEDGSTYEQASENVSFLKHYLVVVVQCGIGDDVGNTTYLDEDAVRQRAVLKVDGDEIAPIEKVPPMVSATVAAMKEMIGEDGMHILIFPAKVDGKQIVDEYKRDTLTLVLKKQGEFPEIVYTWHTPWDAVSPVEACAKCQGELSAKWSYCPWCGAEIAEAK